MSKDNFFSLALENHKKNNLNDAKNLYNEVLKLDPDHEHANNNLGNLFYSVGNYEKAKIFIKKAIKINPYSTDALSNLGAVYARLNESDKAINCYISKNSKKC